jgi:hypothetical protein
MRLTVLNAVFLLMSVFTGVWAYLMNRFLTNFNPNETDERLRYKHQIYTQIGMVKKLRRTSLLMAVIFLLKLILDSISK